MQNEQLRTNASKYRYACILAFITAWKAAATPVNALAGAKCTGIYPFNPNAPRNSMFVRNLTPLEQQRLEEREERNAHRFNISCRFLTDADVIEEMANQIVLNVKFPHLCDMDAYANMNYSSIVTSFREKVSASTIMLSPIPPLFHPARPPKYFN